MLTRCIKAFTYLLTYAGFYYVIWQDAIELNSIKNTLTTSLTSDHQVRGDENRQQHVPQHRLPTTSCCHDNNLPVNSKTKEGDSDLKKRKGKTSSHPQVGKVSSFLWSTRLRGSSCVYVPSTVPSQQSTSGG